MQSNIDIQNVNKIYAAGVIDARGGIFINERKSRCGKNPSAFILRVQICSRSKDFLEQIVNSFGGTIRKSTIHQGFVWTLASYSAYQFLLDIKPFIRVRTDELKTALEFCRLIRLKAGGNQYKISQDEYQQRKALRIRLCNLKKRRFKFSENAENSTSV